MTNVGDRFPNSIREYLDAGGDVTRLPFFDELVDEVTFARAAGVGEHQRAVAEAMVHELAEKGAEALPADLHPSEEDRSRMAAEMLRHHSWTVELLSDERLARRFDLALPEGRLEHELTLGDDYRRRDVALATIEDFASDGDATTDELEKVADVIDWVLQHRGER